LVLFYLQKGVLTNKNKKIGLLFCQIAIRISFCLGKMQCGDCKMRVFLFIFVKIKSAIKHIWN